MRREPRLFSRGKLIVLEARSEDLDGRDRTAVLDWWYETYRNPRDWPPFERPVDWRLGNLYLNSVL